MGFIKKTPREEEDIRQVTAGGRTFYIKKYGRKLTAHRTFQGAIWDVEDESVYKLFNKRELQVLFSNAKLKLNPGKI